MLVAPQGNEVVMVDTRNMEERFRGAFPGGGLRKLCRLEDGRVYGLTGEYLFRWDLEGDRIVPLARMEMKFLAIPRPGLFVPGTENAAYRLELREEA